MKARPIATPEAAEAEHSGMRYNSTDISCRSTCCMLKVVMIMSSTFSSIVVLLYWKRVLGHFEFLANIAALLKGNRRRQSCRRAVTRQRV